MQLKNLSAKISLSTLVLLIFLISIIKLNNPQQNILSYDVFGFYMYLPATFIYDDPAIRDVSWIEDVNAKYKNTNTIYQLFPTQDGRNVIRFSPGMAIMMSPFFMMGHVYASMAEDSPADGYSYPYQWAIIVAGLFYTIIGLIFLRKILLKFLSDKVTAITLLILCLSSSLFFFITYGNTIPHVYAFMLNALIVWLTIRWHEDHKKIHAILLGLVLGLAVISRISEILMVIIPVLWGVYNIDTLVAKIKMVIKYRMHVLLMLAAGILAILPQLFYWKMASGEWLFWAYNDPGSSLNLSNPRFAWVLFGFRKGFLVYAPVMIFAFVGFYQLFKRNKGVFVPLILISFFHIYLIASFTSLVAFGWRAFIELYLVLAIPLAFFIAAVQRSKLYIRIAVYSIILAMTVLNLFQVWQLNNGILDGYRMTKEYYFRIFAKTNITEEDRKYMLVERSLTAYESIPNESDFNHSVIADFDFESPTAGQEQYYDTTYAHSGTMSFRMDASIEFSPTVRKEFHELSDNYYGWVRASVWVYPVADPKENQATLVIAFRHGSQNYKYRGYTMNSDRVDLRMNQWNLITADYMSPELLSKSDKLEVYVWYPGKENIWIDDFKIEFFDPKY